MSTVPDLTPSLPLSAWTASQRRRIKGVLTDIDDTLTEDGRIMPQALQALELLHQARIPVVAITGRPAGWSEPWAMTWPMAGIVAENGAVALRRDRKSTRLNSSH